MSYSQAADEVRKILKGFRAVEQVSEALEKVGSLENAAKEAEKRLADLNDQCDRARAAANMALVDVQGARDEAKRIKTEAIAKADQKVSKAQADALNIIENAKAEAVVIETAVTTWQANLSDLKDACKSASEELAAIEKKIAAAKKQVAAILG
jgi:predicted  nucleic acid-binding Zn-ribbon protein